MKTQKDIFDIFIHDKKYNFIMKRMLEATLAESFHSVLITKAKPGYPIIYVNKAFSKLTGYGPHELLGQSPSILQGSNTDQQTLNRLNDDLMKGNRFHGKAVNYRKDGSQFMMEWKITPIRNEKFEITHYIGIQREDPGL